MSEEEVVAALVVESDYARRSGQVAKVSTERLIFIKPKRLARSSFELVVYPIAQCSAVSYGVRWAIVPMVLGAFLVGIVLAFFALDIPEGSTVPVGAMVISVGFGITLFRGPKRHRLTFTVGDKVLKWQSSAGEFKFMSSSALKVVAFARQRGLLRE